jgi:hypothetical protein
LSQPAEAAMVCVHGGSSLRKGWMIDGNVTVRQVAGRGY